MTTFVPFARDERGTIAIMAAAAFCIASVLAAFAIDFGSLYLQRRQAQGAADLAAIAAANNPDRAYEAALATLNANGVQAFDQLAVETGHYRPDAALDANQRFSVQSTSVNAVRVKLTSPGQLHFAGAFMPNQPVIEVEATAATDAVAAFSLGSRLLALRSGLANEVLSALLGTELELSAMDYEALASAEIDAFRFLDALSTTANLDAVTYDDVLQSSVDVADVLSAAADVASGDDLLLRDMAGQATGAGRITTGSLVDLGPLASLNIGDPRVSGFDVDLSALELLQATAVLAGGGHQVAINLDGEIPGLATLRAELTVGEAMQHSGWVSVGQPDSELATAQTRLRLTATIGGTGLFAGTEIRLPLYVQLASARARLAAVACDDEDSGTVSVAAQPGLATLAIGRVSGNLDDLPARPRIETSAIVSAPLLRVTGKSVVEIAELEEDVVSFDPDEIGDGTIKRAGAHDVLQSAIASLLGKLELNVEVGRLRLGSAALLNEALVRQLAGTAAPLDTAISGILEALGLHLGEADIQVHGVGCRAGVLTG